MQGSTDAWYFDSGCSTHMTGNRPFFFELKECASGHVIFGDGAKGRIIAKCNIAKINQLYLNDVRYVERVKANLISVSQLCDQGYNINFSKDSCELIDENNRVLMNGCSRLIIAIIGYPTILTFATQSKRSNLVMAQETRIYQLKEH